jgi:hypothetical protein
MRKKNLHITQPSTEWFDLPLLLECATDFKEKYPAKKPRITGLFEFLIEGGSIEGLTRRELYLLYLKYEEQLSHSQIGSLFGNTIWASNYDFRQIVPKLKHLLEG